MSASGQKRTSRAITIYVRYRAEGGFFFTKGVHHLERPAVEAQAGQWRPLNRTGEDDILGALFVKQGDGALNSAEMDPFMGRGANQFGIGNALMGDDEHRAADGLAGGDDIARKRPRTGNHGQAWEVSGSPIFRHDFVSRPLSAGTPVENCRPG